MSDGKHEFFIKAVDQAQNIAQKSYTWTIDTVKPFSFIDNEIGKTNNLPDSISGSISGDDVVKVEVQLQKGQNSKFLKRENNKFIWMEDNPRLWLNANFNPGNKTWVFNLPKLIRSEDFYYIRSRAIDKNGNIGEASEKSFIFDKTSPTKIENINLSLKNNLSKLEITWPESNDLNGINYYKLGYNGHTTTTPANIFTLDIKNKTNYKIKLKAFDRAGNSGPWSNERQKLISTSESIIINEVQVNQKEFIELYNPTQNQINLSSWYFAYYSSNQNWDGSTKNNPDKNKPYRLKEFPNNAKIQAKGYYLIGIYDFPDISLDWQIKTETSRQPYSNGQLSNKSGSVVIYNFNPKGKNSGFLRKNAIDTLGWGLPHIFETNPYQSEDEDESLDTYLKGKSLERKNKNDTSNNKTDFSISKPTPQNSQGNWLLNWQKRDVLVIKNNKNSKNLKDQQVKIKVTHKDSMNNDFSDIRFTDASGLNILDYFRESYKEGESAIFWIKIKKIPAYGEIKIYKYYKNNNAKYNGSGKDVFLWFDDFKNDTSNQYIKQDAVWNTNKGIVKIGADCMDNVDKGFISPKGLTMKNVYIKAKMFLRKANHRKAYNGFITYRDQGNNFWMYGIANRGRDNKSKYRGLTFTKKINNSFNFIKQDKNKKHQYNKWFNLEVSAYNSEHKLNFEPVDERFDNNIKPVVWHFNSYYNKLPGKIYFKGDWIDNNTGLKLDYIMIGKSTKYNLIVKERSDDYKIQNPILLNKYPNFPGWQNREEIKIINKGTKKRIDNIVKFEIEYKNGMNFDFSDLRFVDANTKQKLPYWFEDYSGNISEITNNVVVWLKIPKINPSSYKDVYMYYNKPSATYAGNPNDVFLWYDDFTSNTKDNYNVFDANWNTKAGIVSIGANTGNNIDKGFISPKGLKMKNVYIKAKMLLRKANHRKSYNGFITYRDQGNNFWMYGVANRGRNNKSKYRGLTFTKKINNSFNFIKQDHSLANKYNKWFNLEVSAYNSEHKLKFSGLGKDMAWKKYSHYNKLPGKIYFKGDWIDNNTGLKLDHIMIAKYESPKLEVVLPGESFDFESIPYNRYAFKGWANRDEVTIKNTGNTSSTNAVMKIKVNYKDGMKSDFSDIRFVDPQSNKELYYWNDSYVEDESALFWVKASKMLPQESKDIYMYYNNPSAVYKGTPNKIFAWYEDFETKNINIDNNIIKQGNINISSKEGVVKMRGESKILNTDLDIKNFYIKTKILLPCWNSLKRDMGMIDYRIQDNNNFWSLGINNDGVCKNGECYYGANAEVTELGQTFIPLGLDKSLSKKISGNWARFSGTIYDTHHDIDYVIKKDDPNNEITRCIRTNDDRGVDKSGLITLRSESHYVNCPVYFDYILIAPYNPNIKVN